MKRDRAAPTVLRGQGTTAGAVLVAAVAVLGMWGPWFASGSTTRNSFGFFRAAQVLGIEWVTPFRVAWFLLPIVPVVAVALIVFGARRSGLALLLGLGSVLAIAGALSMTAFEARLGSTLAAAAGTATVLIAAMALVASVRVRNVAVGPAEARPRAEMPSASGEEPKLSTENGGREART